MSSYEAEAVILTEVIKIFGTVGSQGADKSFSRSFEVTDLDL